MRSRFLALGLLVVATLGAGTSADVASAQPAAACGAPGQAPCPLQAWMRRHMGPPLASHDMPQLAGSLDRVARLQPDPGWASWGAIAASGAAAARRGDTAGARGACKACHDTWREPYKQRYRGRPVPP